MSNSWFKKEKPLLGMMGSGGGLAFGGRLTPKVEASGGTTATYSNPEGNFKSHTFSTPHNANTTDSTFVVTVAGNIDVIIIGGGGGGGDGNANGGGGGGGSVLVGTNVPVSETGGPGGNGIYPMSIGHGGAGRQSDQHGENGSTSSIYVDQISGQADANGGSGGHGYNRNNSPVGNGAGASGPAGSAQGGAANLWPVPGPMNGGNATWTAHGNPGSARNAQPSLNMGGCGGGSGPWPTTMTVDTVIPDSPGYAMPGLPNTYRTGSEEWYGAGGGGANYPPTGANNRGMYGGKQGDNSNSTLWSRGGSPPNPWAGSSPVYPTTHGANAGNPGQPLYGSGGGGARDSMGGGGGAGSIIIRYLT